MKNPPHSLGPQRRIPPGPGHYRGHNWYDTNDTSPQNDSRGVHRNSRVQNRWYPPALLRLVCPQPLICRGPSALQHNPHRHGARLANHLPHTDAVCHQPGTECRHPPLPPPVSQRPLWRQQPPSGSLANAWDIVIVTSRNATGINSIGQSGSLTLDPSPAGEGSWYTLDGRLLEGKPTKKSMYIHNGKKIVVR